MPRATRQSNTKESTEGKLHQAQVISDDYVATVPVADATYVKFLSRVQSLLKDSGLEDQYRDYDGTSSYRPRRDNGEDPHLVVSWETGGASGGSCWNDDSPKLYSTGHAPLELTGLDVVLEGLKPNIGFLQYKRLVRALVVSASVRTDSDCYGNYTNTTVVQASLKSLYEYFIKEGWECKF